MKSLYLVKSPHRVLNSGSTAAVRYERSVNHLSHVADICSAFIENMIMLLPYQQWLHSEMFSFLLALSARKQRADMMGFVLARCINIHEIVRCSSRLIFVHVLAVTNDSQKGNGHKWGCPLHIFTFINFLAHSLLLYYI